MSFRKIVTALGIVLLGFSLVLISAQASQKDEKAGNRTKFVKPKGTTAMPADGKEVCMRLSLGVERWAIDNQGIYPSSIKQMIDAGYIEFPSNINLVTKKPIKAVPVPGSPGDVSYVTIHQGKERIGYYMIVYGDPSRVKKMDCDLDNNGWPDGVVNWFASANQATKGELTDPASLIKNGYKLFENLDNGESLELNSLYVKMKPIEKVMVTAQNGKRIQVSQFKGYNRFKAKRLSIKSDQYLSLRLDLQAKSHNLFLALMRYATDNNRCPYRINDLIEEGYIKDTYVNPRTGLSARNVPVGVWSPGDFYYLTNGKSAIIVINDPIDIKYQSISLHGELSRGMLIASYDSDVKPHTVFYDAANFAVGVSVSREMQKVKDGTTPVEVLVISRSK